jgi:hypothetical protein
MIRPKENWGQNESGPHMRLVEVYDVDTEQEQPVRAKRLRWNGSAFEFYGNAFGIGDEETHTRLSDGDRLWVIWHQGSGRWLEFDDKESIFFVDVIRALGAGEDADEGAEPGEHDQQLGSGVLYRLDRDGSGEAIWTIHFPLVWVSNPHRIPLVAGHFALARPTGWINSPEGTLPEVLITGTDLAGFTNFPFYPDTTTRVLTAQSGVVEWVEPEEGSLSFTINDFITYINNNPGEVTVLGDTVDEGYCIEIDGVDPKIVHLNQITDAAGTQATGIDTNEFQFWIHPPAANSRDDAAWTTVTGYDVDEVQLLGHDEGVWKAQHVEDWLKEVPGGPPAAGQKLVLVWKNGEDPKWELVEPFECP